MLKCVLDTETSNKALHDGTLPGIFETLMQRIQPEAAYFTADGGSRTLYAFFDMKEAADMPFICENLFNKLNAQVSLQPAMNNEDLQRGLQKAFNA